MEMEGGSLKSLCVADVWKALKAALCCASAGALGLGLVYFAVNLPKLPGFWAWLSSFCERVGVLKLRLWGQ